MKRRGVILVVVIVALVAITAATFGFWREALGNLLSPPTVDEYGVLAYELVSETPVHPYPQATSVRLFVEQEWDLEQRPAATPYVESAGRLLTPAQRRAFEAALSKRSRRGGSVAACFIPHHFFRYYDARGRQVGEVAVCFCCSGAAATPQLFPYEGGILKRHQNELAFDREQLKALIRSLGLPTDVWCRETAKAA